MCSWQERSDWLVFGCVVGRSEATGLYLGGHLAGAERLACILVSHCGGIIIKTLTPRLFGNSPIRYYSSRRYISVFVIINNDLYWAEPRTQVFGCTKRKQNYTLGISFQDIWE